MVILLKPLKWSPDGCQIETIEAGEHDELPARAIEIAVQIGILAEAETGSVEDIPPVPPPDSNPAPSQDVPHEPEPEPMVVTKPEKTAKK
ncbi:TPA: hypothetical protein NVL72_004042 [Citrobacter freundii]|uniref:hypothetical protein n=1 Tax=Enterobacteriaceae TaxID=543 RepID=UPI0008FCFE7C|nr:hypothetical protein [Citrobacter freundii]OIY11660.1 hypothetical protein BED43_20260 [Citrobacter freundii]OIZ53399.1 hypothetical protein BEH74_19600 [Citrobacter freundii]HAW3686735.1 hypothetical protein [Escherichia coli]HCJ7438572.1 hypothetical protein [Citrobacter freundii]